MADEINAVSSQTANQTPVWAEKIIAVHNSVASGYVSHAVRIRANHYFCWQEDDDHDFLAGNVHDEKAMSGYTDFFTKYEFDPWAGQLEAAFDAAGIAYQRTGVTYEPDTGFFHWSWDWEVCY